MKFKFTYLILSFFIAINFSHAQTNIIPTAVPFLTINADARSFGLGWSGAATSPTIFAQNLNPAKYAFFNPKKNILNKWDYKYTYKLDTLKQDSSYFSFKEKIKNDKNQENLNCIDSTMFTNDFSLAVSYTPFLRDLAKDMSLSSLVGYIRLDPYQSIGASLRYMDWGKINFKNEFGEELGQQNPHEFAVDLSYVRMLSEHFSGAVSIRYIHSDLTGGQMVGGIETHAGNSFASDLSFYYINNQQINNKCETFSTGIYISNIENKISYTDGETEDFLPTNLKLGTAYSTEIDKQSSVSLTLDLNKLLVPTPNTSKYDSITGLPLNQSVISGIFNSFSDAPGGLSEELNEIIISGGIEYAYLQKFFLRAGYFHESKNKGNRRFLTTGTGVNVNIQKKILSIDAAYIIPFISNSVLGNSMQFSLAFTI